MHARKIGEHFLDRQEMSCIGKCISGSLRTAGTPAGRKINDFVITEHARPS